MIRLRHLLLACITGLSLTPFVAGGPAFATPETWGTIGSWAIRIDDDRDCYAIARYQKRNFALKMGIDSQNNDVYMMLASDPIDTLEVGAKYHLKFGFDEQGMSHKLVMKAEREGKITYLSSPSLTTDFVENFAYRSSMQMYAVIDGQYKLVEHLPLTGTRAALGEVARCQKAQGPAPAPQRRPRERDYQS
ncbi:hypothetical protein SAMN02990966_03956 [Rhodospirillales bacterium URHD0017]|nr:hypothetical protein SAMN02990966_03956 [Rhodospirillales bacterium URHD0017]